MCLKNSQHCCPNFKFIEITSQNGLEEGADGILGVSAMSGALYYNKVIDSNVVVFSPSENGTVQFLFGFGGINEKRLNSSITWVPMTSIKNIKKAIDIYDFGFNGESLFKISG